MGRFETTSHLVDDRIALEATGTELTFQRSGLTYYAKTGATTTAASCGAFANLPAGLRFTLDNSNGSGDMTISPPSGSPLILNTLEVFDFVITQAGTLLGAAVTAYPTS